MKNKYQKQAEELKNKLPYIYVTKLENNRSDYRACINGEPYLTVGALPAFNSLERLKRWARKHGWKQSDLFPCMAGSSDYYGALTFLVRVNALKEGGDDLKNYMCKNKFEAFEESDKKNYDKAIELCFREWPTHKEDWRFEKKQMEDADFGEAFRVWEERRRLIRINPDDEEPDIETCIRVLKKNGYKIQKPVVTYEDV